ncbi:hypothetical protein C7Y72_05080 [Paraconexibacter algicola]|uniref:Transglycosylase SLT domain-containing protein n=1 Tax=Paraconexibacter algicola TaxID=2133960 RepID=A0A2T4UIK0_9ACTN|nr:hypothetical protein C7Y72_05080 [Paraconexibacter algicola]
MPGVSSRRSPRSARPYVAVALALLAVVVVAGAAILRDGSGGGLRPGSGGADGGTDPLAYRDGDRAALERAAADGLAHVLYAKSPGGAVATAQRVARWRPLIEEIAGGDGGTVDPDTLEAIVFLESAGREDARVSDDLEGAAGLTQILAETGTNLLGMRVDVRASERLTRGIARGSKVAARVALRRRVDERFDPAKALAGTVRYLGFARKQLGDRLDLAVAGYHMGVGNLQEVLRRFGEGDDVPYARLYFDSTPVRHPDAYEKLASLGDDSATYLWRVRAAQEIMRTWRADPAALRTLAARQTAKNSAEEVLHPKGSTPIYEDPFALGRARAAGTLRALDADELDGYGIRLDPQMGELAPRLQQSRRLYRALRPEALAVLAYIGTGVRQLAGDDDARLTITSSVRDTPYQRLLTRRNIEATRSYSLHTTGFAFDISRTYSSRAQARAFQFFLDRLTALNLIAWVREPGAIHVTVSGDARRLLGVLDPP